MSKRSADCSEMALAIDLWESIFTPGTTPSLVIATHVSFAALLVTLIALLVATKNIHFVVLTVLASGLWVAITWFITELKLEKERQERAKMEEEGGNKQNVKQNAQTDPKCDQVTKSTSKPVQTRITTNPVRRQSRKT